MALTKPKQKAPEVIRLNELMARRDLTPARLAALPGMQGFSNRRVTNVCAGQDTSWPIRAAINAALGIEIFIRPTSKARTSKTV